MSGCRMRACLALCMAAALIIKARAECGACIEGRCYRQYHLRVSADPSWPLDIDRYTNTLYDTDGDKFRQCQLDIFGRCYTWPHSWGIQRLTVDQHTGHIYGIIVDYTGSSNLYKLDLINTERELLVRGAVYTMFKDRLYYVNYDNGIHSFEHGESRVVTGTEEYDVHSFIVDKKDDIYFETIWNNQYVIKRLSKGIVDRAVYSASSYLMTSDSDGDAVFIDKKSHSVYKATDGQLVEVGVIRDLIYYTVFDKPLFDRDNNLIYRSYLNGYIYLIRDGVANCTISISQNMRIITKTITSTEKYNKHDFTATSPKFYNIEKTRTSTPNENIVANYNMSPNTPTSESSTSNTPDGNTQDFDDNNIMFSNIPVPENPTSSSPNKNTKDYDAISPRKPASEPLTSNKPDANTKGIDNSSSIILSSSIPVRENSTTSSPDGNTKDYNDISQSTLATESTASTSQMSDSSHSEPPGQEAHHTDDHNK